MTKRKARALLDVNPLAVKALTDLGYLPILDGEARSNRQKLDRAVVEAFSLRYAAGKLYAGALAGQRVQGEQLVEHAPDETRGDLPVLARLFDQESVVVREGRLHLTPVLHDRNGAFSRRSSAQRIDAERSSSVESARRVSYTRDATISYVRN